MIRPFSSSVLLYSPENALFPTFFYLLPLLPTDYHFTGKMINVNALFIGFYIEDIGVFYYNRRLSIEACTIKAVENAPAFIYWEPLKTEVFRGFP